MSNQSHNISETLPRHIAIIMDGNGRWAKNQGKERIFGHHKGVETVRLIVEASVKLHIQYLSLFAFSTENWNRPQSEVDALMELLIMAIERELPDLHKNKIRLQTIGDIERLPKHCRESIHNSIEKTSGNGGMTLCIALSYSGKWDICQAATKMALGLKSGKLTENELNEATLASFLSTAHMPEPELLIRTGGETRISNFFLWQSAYTELYFTQKYWPEFDELEYMKAIEYFSNRERRFGKISEQLK
jgi:undecaprenyl diphosphate synthase